MDAGAQDTASQVAFTQSEASLLRYCVCVKATEQGMLPRTHPQASISPVTSIHKVRHLRPSPPLWWCGWGRKMSACGWKR